MIKSTLSVGDNAPQFEYLTQNSNEEILLLFMGRVARPNANEKSKGLVQVLNKTALKGNVKICLIWDNNEEEVQEFKLTIPGLAELDGVDDFYDLDGSVQDNYKSLMYNLNVNSGNESAEENAKFYADATATDDGVDRGFPDYLIKDGKIIWVQENQRFYEPLLILRGWRP